MIKLKQIKLTYQDEQMLRDVSLDIKSGEFIYLIGKSGAGKSSLLKLLHGELDFSGDFMFQNHEVQFDQADYRRQFQRQVKYLSQDLLFDDSKTVVDNLAIYDNFRGLPEHLIADKVAQLLRGFSLTQVAQHFPAELSGGERARLALAMVIITEPTVLLLDEPTANLDPKMSVQVLNVLERLNAQGVTIILATHDAPILAKFPHRQFALSAGKGQELAQAERQVQVLEKKTVSAPVPNTEPLNSTNLLSRREFQIAWQYTKRHFNQLLRSHLPIFAMSIVLNLLLSTSLLFPKIFQQLTVLQKMEERSHSFSQGIKSISMLRHFNVVLLLVLALLSLVALVFLLAQLSSVIRQRLLLEKDALQARYAIVLDETYVFREFFLSVFFLLLLGAPVNYCLSVYLQKLIIVRVKAFYEMHQLSAQVSLFVPIITAVIFMVFMNHLMRKYSQKLYHSGKI